MYLVRTDLRNFGKFFLCDELIFCVRSSFFKICCIPSLLKSLKLCYSFFWYISIIVIIHLPIDSPRRNMLILKLCCVLKNLKTLLHTRKEIRKLFYFILIHHTRMKNSRLAVFYLGYFSKIFYF